MSSSTSYSGTSYVTCRCGEPAVVRKSTTKENPGKRFFGCQNFGHGDHCNFFEWIDKKLTKSEEQKEDYKLMNNIRVANEDLRCLNESLRETNAQLRAYAAAEKNKRIDIEMRYEVCKAEYKIRQKWFILVCFILMLTVVIVWTK